MDDKDWKGRLFVCRELLGARTNKWKQIISWPHYARSPVDEEGERTRGMRWLSGLEDEGGSG